MSKEQQTPDKFESNQYFASSSQSAEVDSKAADLSKAFMSNVFTYMAAALAITASMAYLFASSEQLTAMLYNVNAEGYMAPNTLGYVVMFAPLGFVLLMSFGFQKMASSTLMILFTAFAAIMGMSLSFVFLSYTSASVFQTFVVTAGTFGIMAFLGYTTKTDLTKMGSMLKMALIGLILAMVVNWFMQSPIMDYVISMIGVLIFTGLTAYDTQKLKRIGSGVEHGSEPANKLAIMGALTLYLDFINLFLFLLRFLGDRR